MSTVEITMVHEKGMKKTIIKEGNCFSVTNEQGEYDVDYVHASELTAQAHLNFWLLFLSDTGYKRI